MATKSFFTDMIIDTPEAAAALEALIESGVTWKRGNTQFVEADEEFMREFYEKHRGDKAEERSCRRTAATCTP